MIVNTFSEREIHLVYSNSRETKLIFKVHFNTSHINNQIEYTFFISKCGLLKFSIRVKVN